MARSSWILLAALHLGPLAAVAPAQTSVPPAIRMAGPPGAKRMEAAAVGAGAPRVDGRLDDPAWQGAGWTSDFVQREPDQGAAPSQKTEVAFLFDREALYVAARMHSDDPVGIRAPLTRRDQDGNAERLVVFLDTYRDRRTAYAFAVTAAGVRLDWYHPEDNPSMRDGTFDPVWEARVGRDSLGWTAEVRIPFSQLRFNAGEEQVWGANVTRVVPARNEEDAWVLVPRDAAGWSSRFGELVGIRRAGGARRIEVAPYVASEARLASGGLVDPADPFRDGREAAARAGVDLKMGIGPNLTLDATVNPDFGQVDADPAEVNLSAFESFFEERRPFFTEGRQMLAGVGPDYLYSRRIGAAPHGEATGDFTRAPQTTTILGAAKLTGRLPSGLSVGALAALTGSESARTFDGAADAFGTAPVEPLTGYGALRLQQELGRDASVVGLTLTGVRRDPGDGLAALLPREAVTGGIDWNRRFQGGAYELLGHVGFSRVAGDTAAIAAVQQASARYLQRPGQDHVDFDPTRTSLSGWSAALRGGKRSGRWRWNGGVWAESPGWELNDLGRLGDTDNVNTWAGLTYHRSDPGPLARRWLVNVFTENGWNFGGVRNDSELGVFAEATWNNFWRTMTSVGVEPAAQSDYLTRGGPLMLKPHSWWWNAGIVGNPARKTGWETHLFSGGDELGSWRYELRGIVRTQLGDRLALAVEPRFTRRADARQYLATADGGGPATFGGRYVFGRIARSELAAPLRAGYSLTPDLSLDLYAEPFAASGHYSDVGELAAARTHRLRLYGTDGSTVRRDAEGGYTVTDGAQTFTLDNPDFHTLSFRSNAVLRWEWRPGSTLFLVWQQNRSAFDALGGRAGPGHLADALGAEGENVLALKLSYWLPL